MKKLYTIQTLILLAGTIFAWLTVYSDFAYFYNLYGSISRISNCVIPNPVTTPCFYGAFAFLASLIWSWYILKYAGEKKADQQRKLNLLLIASTIFAWSNLSLQFYNFYFKTEEKLSCSGVPTENIFTTACFIGSLIFLVVLIISLLINYKNNKNEI